MQSVAKSVLVDFLVTSCGPLPNPRKPWNWSLTQCCMCSC